jgi:hypothetical protein
MKVENIPVVVTKLAEHITNCTTLKVYLKQCSIGLKVFNPEEADILAAMALVPNMGNVANASFIEAKEAFLSEEIIPVEPEED